MACVSSEVQVFLSITELGSSSTGFFTQISTLADVQENVMEYLHVLSRPKVIDQEHDVVWTEAYIDSTVSPRGPGGVPEVASCNGGVSCVNSRAQQSYHSSSIMGFNDIFLCRIICVGPLGKQGW